jgi:hypothetical protein
MIGRIAAIIGAATCAGLVISFVWSLSTNEKAFATVRAPATDNSVVSQPPAQRTCGDFEDWFLNAACSKAHAKHTARTKHHVATFVSSRAADQIVSAKR